jgi:hypothetical protein
VVAAADLRGAIPKRRLGLQEDTGFRKFHRQAEYFVVVASSGAPSLSADNFQDKLVVTNPDSEDVEVAGVETVSMANLPRRGLKL